MKKIFSLIFFLFPVSCFSQNPLQQVLKTYFRTQPFDIKFSSFIATLQQDPWFSLHDYSRRTDSSFFFLSGTYKNFNPFRVNPKELRLVLAEEEIIHADSSKTLDTIMNLQLMCVLDTGITEGKATQKEFKRFYNNYAEGFYSKTYDVSFDRQHQTVAEAYNYFIFPFSVSPLTAAWGKLPDKHYTFTITIRFKVRENMADFILAPNDRL